MEVDPVVALRHFGQEHKRRMEEAKRRDHRLLGKKLDLFSLQEDAGGGLVRGLEPGAVCKIRLGDLHLY